MIIIHSLREDPEAYEMLHALCTGMYLGGECYAFAAALHEGLGWPIIGLMAGDVLRHAAVRSPDGRLIDARGFILEEEFGTPFGITPPYHLTEVCRIDLREGETEKGRASSTLRARRYAEILFPELPWKDSLLQRAAAFLAELEAISQKYGLWLRPATPAGQPILYERYGDESGYEIRPTHNGFGFTLDRRLQST